MTLKVNCPECGKKYGLNDDLAGKRIRCKGCDHVFRIPEPVAEASSTDKLTFRCDGCQKKYVTPSNLAGKKIVCKACGQSIRIPGAAVTTSSASQGKATAAPEPSVASAASLDIYGLDDDPASAPGSRGVGEDTRGGAAGEEEKLPPRAGYEPLTESKKKKIARRAAKSDQEKSSFAGMGMGISFGTVLFISLFLGRIYFRVIRPMTRVANAVNATADAEPFDAKKSALADDENVAQAIRANKAPEAREWLDPKHRNHVVFEMGNDGARKMVEEFYQRGAEQVVVLDVDDFDGQLVTAEFGVKLPSDPEKRKRCFELYAQILGDDPNETTPDVGQTYLDVLVD